MIPLLFLIAADALQPPARASSSAAAKRGAGAPAFTLTAGDTAGGCATSLSSSFACAIDQGGDGRFLRTLPTAIAREAEQYSRR